MKNLGVGLGGSTKKWFQNVPYIRSQSWASLRSLFHSKQIGLFLEPVCAAKVDWPWGVDMEKPGVDLPEAYGSPPNSKGQGRRAGIVLHPTSLPGKYGMGEIGAEALAFVDWLAASGIQLWQLLPLVPPETTYWSPYSGLDALCGHTLLIPLDELVQLGLLLPDELPEEVPITRHADFNAVSASKTPLLDKSAERLLLDNKFSHLRLDMEAFRSKNSWIEESALFSIIANLPGLEGLMWWDWPIELRKRDESTLQRLRNEHSLSINKFVALQFLFDYFWRQVKAYANSRGVKLGGDMPIYVGGQSADVWAHQYLFELSSDGKPLLVSGVPPDAFSATGQLWGSPLYDWKAHAADGYSWWVQRFSRSLSLYDETRVDHFRAFAGYWAVEATRDTAMIGTWKRGPGVGLFSALKGTLGDVPILAEDLGVITPDVTSLREELGAPGMCVLQFAWGGGPRNTHLPHNVYENCFVYPGTHDNQTAVGWWKSSVTPAEKTLIRQYLGMTGEDISWAFIHAAYTSVAHTAVVTMQDIMRLDDESRMNTPGKAEGNWTWRVGDSSVWEELRNESVALQHLAHMSDRLGKAAPPLSLGKAGSATFH